METAADRLRADLHLAWNRQLYRWWHHYNDEYLDGALAPPQIVLSRSEKALGQWDGHRRRLQISALHIERDPWSEVMETLRHEMAHQYAGEVLGAVSEAPHGGAFRRACERLRCRPEASWDRDTAGHEADGRVLRRLKKVLSLAASPNQHEAEAAVHKARRLLLEYNIDLVEADRQRQFFQRAVGPVKGRRAAYELWLAQILHRFFFVEVLWAPSYAATTDREGTQLHIYGTAANLDMAAYVHQYLERLLDELWTAYRQTAGVRGNRDRLRYKAGVLDGFYHELERHEHQRQQQGQDPSQALVWRGDAQLQAYYRYLNPRVRTRKGGGVRLDATYEHGVQTGRKVRIRRPLAASGSGVAGLLGE